MDPARDGEPSRILRDFGGVAALYADFDFAEGGYGWAVVKDGVEASSDGGDTWVPLNTGRSGPVDSLDLAGAGQGWLVQSGTLLRTTDGGASWQELPNPCAAHAGMPVVSFADATYGWAFCRTPHTPAGEPQELWITEDAGGHWQSREVPPQKIRLWGPQSELSLLDHDHAWFGNPGNGIFETNDGGLTWQNILPAGNEVASGWPDRIDADSGIAEWFDSSLRMLMRSNGGEWQETSPYATQIPLDFVSATAGFATLVAPGAPVWAQTGDGGATWTRLAHQPPPGQIDFVDATTWFQLRFEGPGYRAWRTTDGGATWQPTAMAVPGYELPITPRLQFTDALHGRIVHGLDMVTSTSDGGVRASDAVRPRVRPRISEAGTFVSETEGWLVTQPRSSRATLYHTVDGGQTWSAIARFPGGRVFAALPGGELWVEAHVPDHAGLLHTTDGGATWTRLRLPGIRIDHLAAVPGALWLSSGGTVDRRFVWRSTDGGRTWSRANQP